MGTLEISDVIPEIAVLFDDEGSRNNAMNRVPIRADSFGELYRTLFDPECRKDAEARAWDRINLVANSCRQAKIRVWNQLVDAGLQPTLDQETIDALINQDAVECVWAGRVWEHELPLYVIDDVYEIAGAVPPAGDWVVHLSSVTERSAFASAALAQALTLTGLETLDDDDDGDGVIEVGGQALVGVPPAF